MFDFFMGFIIAILISMWFAVAVDSNFEYHKNRVNKLIELCNSHSSTPKLFDGNHVICANGITIKYRDLIG